MHRSYLFAPGHNAKLLAKVFDAGADAVILDLEDAVPPDAKDTARTMVADALTTHPAWVRINAAHTPHAANRSTTSAGSLTAPPANPCCVPSKAPRAW